jgi:hypothetical protein
MFCSDSMFAPAWIASEARLYILQLSQSRIGLDALSPRQQPCARTPRIRRPPARNLEITVPLFKVQELTFKLQGWFSRLWPVLLLGQVLWT